MSGTWDKEECHHSEHDSWDWNIWPHVSRCSMGCGRKYGKLWDEHSGYLFQQRAEGIFKHTVSGVIWIEYNQFRKLDWGLPWWRSGWESACQCRGHGFEPWSGKIPHAMEQLGLWAATTEPVRLELVLRNKRGRDSERPAHRDEEWPPLAATRESPRTETKTQHSQK